MNYLIVKAHQRHDNWVIQYMSPEKKQLSIAVLLRPVKTV